MHHNTQSLSQKINFDSEENLKKTVYDVGPHIYRLTGLEKEEDLRFIVFGCQGDKGESQWQTAALMNQLCQQQKVCFVIGLGDNFYDNGVFTIHDKRFDTQYQDLYGNKQFPHLAELPFFIALGNHDGNRSNLMQWKNWGMSYVPSVKEYPVGEAVEINQVAYTYQFKDKSFYQQNDLPINELPRWNMPYFFYSIIVEKTQFFIINSNTYIKDYVAWHDQKEDQSGHINQAQWLAKAYQEAIEHGRTPILIAHHPLDTRGKRAFNHGGDAHLYLDESERKRICEILKLSFENEGKLYNKMLLLLFIKQNMQFATSFAAHDHFLAATNNHLSQDTYKLTQVISGGGGGKLQERKFFGKPEEVICFAEQNGCVVVSAKMQDPKEIFVEMHTVQSAGKDYLKFNNQSPHVIQEDEKDAKVLIIRKQMLQVCRDYQIFLNELNSTKKSLTVFSFFSGPSHHDLKVMQHIELYLKKYKTDGYADTLRQLAKLMSEFKDQAQGSLYDKLNLAIKELSVFGGKTIQELDQERNNTKEIVLEYDQDIELDLINVDENVDEKSKVSTKININ